jgi:phospholipase/lecithinase/hemolysin
MKAKMLRTIVGLLLMLFGASAFAGEPTVRFRHMFVLGDSLSDQGNLFSATSALADTFNLPPIPASDHYYRGRFSNGENYAGLLARKLGFTLTPSQLGGSNYAFGGARADYNRVEFRPGLPPQLPNGPYPIGVYPWSLDGEREAFLASVRRADDPNGLYVVWSGSNDLSDALTALLFLRQDPAPAIAKAVLAIRNAITAFQTAGARTVLVLNIPDLGVVPSVTQAGPAVAALATRLSQQFNAALDATLASITGVNIVVFDTYALLDDIVAHPGDYGLENVTQPCFSGYVEPDPTATVCADPDKYAFWDVEHPTTRFHAIIADELYTSLLDCESVQGARSRSASHRFVSRCAVNVP